MEDYRVLSTVGEGAFGVVFKAKHISSGKIVALKSVPLSYAFSTDNPTNPAGELNGLRTLHHHNIIGLIDYFASGSNVVFVTEYVPFNLADLLCAYQHPLPESMVKRFMYMIFSGLLHCHQSGIIHRDIKPGNLLIQRNGILKIADFGLARVFDPEKRQDFSHQVATRWYRAPELLFGSRTYGPAVDMWSAGCIMCEMLLKAPPFPGLTDIGQLVRVIELLGSPSEDNWPGVSLLPDFGKIQFVYHEGRPVSTLLRECSDLARDLADRLIVYNPDVRLTAAEALVHPFLFSVPRPLSMAKVEALVTQLVKQGCVNDSKVKGSPDNTCVCPCESEVRSDIIVDWSKRIKKGFASIEKQLLDS